MLHRDRESTGRFSAVEYFIHPRLHREADQLHRVRILVGVLMVFTAVVIAAALIVLISRFPLRSIIGGGLLCLLAASAFVTLLFRLRRRADYLPCAIATVLIAFIIICLGICVSGGPSGSSVTQLLVIPLLAAYFFGSIRWGGYTVAITFAMLLVFIACYLADVRFPATIDTPEQMAITQFLVSFVNISVIAGLAFTYEHTAATLKRERDSEHAKYIELARTDALTGLANRRNFDTLLSERMAQYAAQNPPQRFALGYIDLDRFKPINDRHGHAVGDEVLCVVSERLRAALRGSDLVARHGGDEFMLVLDQAGDQAAVDIMAQRLLHSIEQPISTSVGLLQISGSLGFALFPLDAVDIEALKRAADSAMYAAKRQQSGWHCYRADLQAVIL